MALDVLRILSNSRAVQRQAKHLDFLDKGHIWKEDIPLICIIAIEDTSILVVKGSLKNEFGQLERILLKKGDVIVMHPLCVHAGDDFQSSNTRIHVEAMGNRGIAPKNEVQILV